MKKQNYRNHCHQLNHLNQSSGFSLVELLVVVSIVSILSVSSVIGFGYLGDTLKAKEAAGFISDIMKQEELKVLRGDFSKAVVHILADYLVIEEWQADAIDVLALGSNDCDSNNYKILYKASGNLTQKDQDGNVIQVKPVTSSSNECIIFKSPTNKDLEWNYQLVSGEQSSAVLRFVHFNLQRDDMGGGLTIRSSAGSRVEIFAPYGRKRYFRPDGTSASSLPIVVGNVEKDLFEVIFL